MNHYLTFIIIASTCLSLNASNEQAHEQEKKHQDCAHCPQVIAEAKNDENASSREEAHKSCDNGTCTKPKRDIDFGTWKETVDKDKEKRENK